jgi:hypothetical protein
VIITSTPVFNSLRYFEILLLKSIGIGIGPPQFIDLNSFECISQLGISLHTLTQNGPQRQRIFNVKILLTFYSAMNAYLDSNFCYISTYIQIVGHCIFCVEESGQSMVQKVQFFRQEKAERKLKMKCSLLSCKLFKILV